ncbi:MAG: complex I subunit 1 family protein [Caldilineaceae bacterium]
MIPALVIWGVIPVSKGVPAMADVNIGFLWILAIAGVESYGLILAGWSSNNNFSLLGALRSSAQMMYHCRLAAGPLPGQHPAAGGQFQPGLPGGDAAGVVGVDLALAHISPLFFICILAETNRSPFDLPETENELVAGYQTEYGGIKFSLFMMAEYINMITTSLVAALTVFGGYRPFGFLSDVLWLGPFVLAFRVIILLFIFIWVRASIQ